MPNDIWIALIASAVGTFFIRVLPLIWMQRHIARRKSQEAVAELPTWLSVFGPLMIAAMFGVSLVPATMSTETWFSTIVSALVTLIAWWFKRSLGWPVFAGVMTYGVVTVIF
ncbi:AzlD domain-containing protein [Sneathiella limimaris]|uniref:AzlD domain-containing protein n=1 Tax=Sneathiella limimaris TaxID=1964213 RepID=UPI00146E3AC4|nr:AzlD domain-containing protein [Sneathiella limimaris]